MTQRKAIVKAARGWLGTPYHHQASLKGVGSDCLGLIRGIWRELYGPEPETMPAYTQDWGSATGSETLIEAACRHLVTLADVSGAEPGDVLVFVCAIAVSPSTRESFRRYRALACLNAVGPG